MTNVYCCECLSNRPQVVGRAEVAKLSVMSTNLSVRLVKIEVSIVIMNHDRSLHVVAESTLYQGQRLLLSIHIHPQELSPWLSSRH